jgi:hypothetical protein
MPWMARAHWLRSGAGSRYMLDRPVGPVSGLGSQHSSVRDTVRDVESRACCSLGTGDKAARMPLGRSADVGLRCSWRVAWSTMVTNGPARPHQRTRSANAANTCSTFTSTKSYWPGLTGRTSSSITGTARQQLAVLPMGLRWPRCSPLARGEPATGAEEYSPSKRCERLRVGTNAHIRQPPNAAYPPVVTPTRRPSLQAQHSTCQDYL